MNATIPLGSVVKILEAVAKGQVPEHAGPTHEVAKGEIVRGTVTSPTARSLYGALSLLQKYESEVAEMRRQLIGARGAGATIEEIEHVSDMMSVIRCRFGTLKRLFWKAIHEEHPETIPHEFGIRKGWKLVCTDGAEWPKEPFPIRIGKLAGHLVPTILGTMIDEKVDAPNFTIGGPIETGEKVLGEISDNRLKVLMALTEQLRVEAAAELPAGMPRPPGGELSAEEEESWELEHKAEGVEWLRKQSLQMLDGLCGYTESVKKTIDLVSNLFWSCVRDTISQTGATDISLRDGWKVVKSQRKREPPSFGVTIVSVPAGSELEKLLARMSGH